MALLGDKYVSVDTVAARIARNYKGIAFDKGDIAEWCFEVVKNIGKYESFVQYKGIKIDVLNKKAKLPCNVYRLLYVHGENGCCHSQYYRNDGTFLNFSDHQLPKDHVTIDYIGFALDEDGIPMIEDGSQEACFWYCLSRLLLEDYLTGKVAADKYQFIDQKYMHYCSVARGSMRWTSINDMEDIHRIAITVIRDSKFPGTSRQSPLPT
jgi:hypothetical protein